MREATARFKVLAAGRRFGKSQLALTLCLDLSINYGMDVWYIGPTFNNVLPMWRQAKRLVGNLPTYKNEQQKYMEFAPPPGSKKRGSIAFKSGDRPDNLRGSGLHYVVLDEAAFMPYELWTDVVYPSLADKKGGALLISSPNGKSNWFYRAYLKGKDANEPDWDSWRFPTVDNPYIDPSIIEAAKRDTPDLKFRQEFLAEFVSDAAGVFRGVDKVAVLSPLSGPRPGRTYIAGLDWGRWNDFTVISIYERETYEQAAIIRFTEIGYELQKERVINAVGYWNIDKIYAEGNSMGAPMVEALQEDGLPIEAVYMTNPTKNLLVEHLSVNIEKGVIKLLSVDTPIGEQQAAELNAYELTRTKSGLQFTYRASRGWNDDIVVANMLANMGIYERATKTMSTGKNPFYGGGFNKPTNSQFTPDNGDTELDREWQHVYSAVLRSGKTETKARFEAYKAVAQMREAISRDKEAK